MNCRAFTLIELLTVIAIISVLISILLPMLGTTRNAAKASVCTSNIRQVNIALLMYTQDHYGYFVPMRQGTASNPLHWFGQQEWINGKRNVDKERSPLAYYFGGDIVSGLECPQFPYNDAMFVRKFQTTSAHYGYNAGLAGWPKIGAESVYVPNAIRPTRRVEEIKSPSTIMTFADAIHRDFSSSFYEPHYVGGEESPDPNVGGHGHLRHNADSLYVAYVDGHVSMYEPKGRILDVIAGSPYQILDTHTGPNSIFGFPTNFTQ